MCAKKCWAWKAEKKADAAAEADDQARADIWAALQEIAKTTPKLKEESIYKVFELAAAEEAAEAAADKAAEAVFKAAKVKHKHKKP